jgi:hypothetical protein
MRITSYFAIPNTAALDISERRRSQVPNVEHGLTAERRVVAEFPRDSVLKSTEASAEGRRDCSQRRSDLKAATAGLTSAGHRLV